MRVLWLVNPLWFIVPVNPRKNRASSELLYKSNRPQVSMCQIQLRSVSIQQEGLKEEIFTWQKLYPTSVSFVTSSTATESAAIKT